MFENLKAIARRLKQDIAALWLAARDRRTPIMAKLVAGLTVGYALSPIDLIPDFIPVLGYLDDLLLVPAGIWLAIRLIPADLMRSFRQDAADLAPGSSGIGLTIVGGTWLAFLAAGCLAFN